jgi:hypothetical protein
MADEDTADLKKDSADAVVIFEVWRLAIAL